LFSITKVDIVNRLGHNKSNCDSMKTVKLTLPRLQYYTIDSTVVVNDVWTLATLNYSVQQVIAITDSLSLMLICMIGFVSDVDFTDFGIVSVKNIRMKSMN